MSQYEIKLHCSYIPYCQQIRDNIWNCLHFAELLLTRFLLQVGSDTGDGSRDSLPTIFPVILPDRNVSNQT